MTALTRSLLVAGPLLAYAAAPAQDCSQIPADAFTPRVLVNSAGLQVSVLPFGGTVQRILVPASDGSLRDIALGYDDATQYCKDPAHPYFGALIGRVANRISPLANGAGCGFELDGTTYSTPCNELHAGTGVDGANVSDTLHGGWVGFDRTVWALEQPDASTLHLTITSPDGDQGFPGELTVNVTYRVLDPTPGSPSSSQGSWDLTYTAVNTGSKATVAALTNHVYLHLGGFQGPSTVLGHVLSMPNATSFQVIDESLLPTGSLAPVTSKPWMDFTGAGQPLGPWVNNTNGTLPAGAIPSSGIDNAFVFAGHTPGAFVPQVRLYAPESRLLLTLSTDQPGVQVYSGNMLTGTIPRKADQTPTPGQPAFYGQHSAYALEAQQYIGAANFPGVFPSIRLAPGQVYTQHTAYEFSWQ